MASIRDLTPEQSLSTPTETELPQPLHHRPRRVVATIVAAAVTMLGVAGWLVHSFFYDASFMQVPPGYSSTEISTCATGETLYFGFAFAPTRDVRLTGAELVGASDAFTVVGIYGINQKQNN